MSDLDADLYGGSVAFFILYCHISNPFRPQTCTETTNRILLTRCLTKTRKTLQQTRCQRQRKMLKLLLSLLNQRRRRRGHPSLKPMSNSPPPSILRKRPCRPFPRPLLRSRSPPTSNPYPLTTWRAQSRGSMETTKTSLFQKGQYDPLR